VASTSPNPEPLIRLDGVGRTYVMGEVRVEVLRDVCLDVRDGEFLVILGPSGSGKTTLLNIVGGLDKPTAGRVLFGDLDLAACTPRQLVEYRRRSVGFVFQFFNLIPTLTARENVMVATEISDAPLDVEETLRLVGLEERMDHFPSQLSGGEQQRVAIARALAKSPRMLLCDEPTGALDFVTGKAVLAQLVAVQRQLARTVVVITHNSAIGRLADRVVRLRSGEVVEVSVNAEPASVEEVAW
jgi:putative ABC transport system ATP-binding protein